MTQTPALLFYFLTKYPLHHFYINPQDLSMYQEGGAFLFEKFSIWTTPQVFLCQLALWLEYSGCPRWYKSIFSGLLTIQSRNQAFVWQIWANCVLNWTNSGT